MPERDRVCDRPNCENPARVHLTQVVDDKTHSEFLCRTCAEKKGIGGVAAQAGQVADLMTQLVGADTERESGEPDPCTFCGLTFNGFRRTGRLGCPSCYTSFDSCIRRLLSRIHGSARHVGKVYVPPDVQTHGDERLEDLRRRLGRAVDSEDFERAAVLRDRIRDIASRDSP